jgi:hypothetical protein
VPVVGAGIMNPHSRHASGAGRPCNEPWARTSERAVWKAYKNGLTLTVTHLVGARGWVAEVEGPGVCERSDAFATRSQAQRWAEDRAGGGS